MDNRLFFPATERNRSVIGEVLQKHVPKRGVMLEIASGSGEHAVAFQKLIPEITLQTSDPEAIYRKSISSWINFENLNHRMPAPIELDVRVHPWPLPQLTCKELTSILCINMIHISSWSCTEALFTGAGKHLPINSPLIIYGPFKINGRHTSRSNYNFDISLKTKNRNWGIRDIEKVKLEGIKAGFKENETIKMPANNFSIVFIKEKSIYR